MLRISKKSKPLALVLSALVLISSIAGAVLTAPVCVFALSAGGIQSTIASIIISLMLQCGVAPVNTNYLNALNTSYGYTIETAISDGLLTETATGLVDSGLSAAIEGASAYTDLGLSDIFTTTATDIGVTAASGAVNIANTAIHVGTLGTIGAFAGAAAVGVGVGVLVNHLGNVFSNFIKNAMAIDSSKDAMSYVNQYGGNVSSAVQANNYENYYYYPDNVVAVISPSISTNNDTLYLADYKQINSNVKRRTYDQYGNFRTETDLTVRGFTIENGTNNVLSSGNIRGDYQNIIRFSTAAEQEAFIQSLREGTGNIPGKISPDLIGPLGNQYYDNQNDTIPGMTNQIPEGADIEPVDMNDYLNYMSTANNNTADGNTGTDIQGEDFDNLIDPLIVNAPVIPDIPIIPDQPVDIPTVPNRPVVPEQPDIPDKPGITQEQMDDALQGATTIDITAIFPFCIPFDLYNLFLIIDTGENRKAPHIIFTFPLTNWQIDVDLAPFDPVAAILRVLELILFIIGLAVATRSLIGAGG